MKSTQCQTRFWTCHAPRPPNAPCRPHELGVTVKKQAVAVVSIRENGPKGNGIAGRGVQQLNCDFLGQLSVVD